MRYTIHTCLMTALTSPLLAFAEPKVEIVGVSKVWDQAPHNAFTDLVRWRDQWWCTFREGKGHVSPDGALRVLVSADGDRWESAALVTSPTADLRDPKLTVNPDGTLLLYGAGALHQPKGFTHQSYAWFSNDGRDWGAAVPIGDPNYWLWRIVWHGKTAYGIGYECGGKKDTRLYHSTDAKTWRPLVTALAADGYPNETGIVFAGDDCYVLLRRDEGKLSGILGHAKPPYTQWKFKEIGPRIGGPQMIRIPDGRLIAVVRLYDRRARTSICSVDPKSGKLAELAPLPSGGDTSYAGLVWHDGLLWISYYSSHEGKTSIYLAKVRVQ